MTELRECPWCSVSPVVEMRDGNAYKQASRIVCMDCGAIGPNNSLSAISAWNRRADDWQPIETAPRDGTEVLVYATLPDHLQWADPDKQLRPVVRVTAWHPDAGWCVDELREATHWCPLRPLSSAG